MKHIKILLVVVLVLLLVFSSSPLEGLAISQNEDETAPASGGEIDGLTYVGHLDTDDAREVAVVGDYAYICDWGPLRIVDISDPTTPVEVGSYSPPYGEGGCGTMAVAGKYVYTGGWPVLNIVDVTNPSAPVRVGRASGLYIPHGMTVDGAYAYIVDSTDTGSGYLYRLLIFDVSNVTHPFITGVFTFTIGAADVAVAGNYAYVANLEAGLRVIDVSNPSAPFEVGVYASSKAVGVTIAGSYAYVAEESYGLRIIDISNPVAPFQVGLFDPEGYYIMKSAVESGYAYLAAFETGVVMLDVSNPAESVMVGLYNTDGWAREVAVTDGYIYAADGFNGLVILHSTYSIRGTVTKAGGVPVAGVTITATGGYTTTTDIFGAYAFNDLESGTYTLTASMEGYSFLPDSLTFTVPPGAVGNFMAELLVTKVFLPVIVLNR